MPLSLVTAPTVEPLTLSDAKLQVRRDHVDDDDEYLATLLIPAVRERAEQATGRQLMRATWDYTLNAFPCEDWIELPKPPLSSVTSVTYVDANGTTQTLSTSLYTVEAPAGPRGRRGRVILNYGEIWPSTRPQPNAVTVRFVAGYGTTSDATPPRLKMGMLLDLGTLFEIREDHIIGQGYTVTPVPIGAERIYRAFKSYPRDGHQAA